MSRVTASAPANIAFVKYWGVADEERVAPLNPSISMTLSECVSETTAEYGPESGEHRVEIADDEGRLTPADEPFARGVRRHLDRIRPSRGLDGAFRVATRNRFPSAAGLASSASGFAALAVAASRAAGQELGAVELSELARISGSGSAARSLWGGFVEWPAERSGAGGLGAAPLAGPDHWELCDIVAIVEEGAKTVSSREGHRRAPSSPHFAARQRLLPDRLARTRVAIADRDLEALGPVLEEEAIELHLVAMSSRPPIFYWAAPTVDVLAAVRALRDEGIGAYATMDAGANVHVICGPHDEPAVAERLTAVPGVRRVIRDRVGGGPAILERHLF